MRSAAAALLCAALLAGCASGPEIPDHAAADRDQRLPGLTLHAWSESDGGTRIHAVVVHDGQTDYRIRSGCGEPWNHTLRDAGGQLLEPTGFAQCETRDVFHALVAAGSTQETLTAWDGRLLQNRSAVAAPPGDYTWTVRYDVRDPEASLRVDLPLRID